MVDKIGELVKNNKKYMEKFKSLVFNKNYPQPDDIDVDTLRSAFEQIPIGSEFTKLGKRVEVVGKHRMSFDRCPWCNSSETLHQFIRDNGISKNNIWEIITKQREDITIAAKEDLCLHCGRTWICELWIHKYIHKGL